MTMIWTMSEVLWIPICIVIFIKLKDIGDNKIKGRETMIIKDLSKELSRKLTDESQQDKIKNFFEEPKVVFYAIFKSICTILNL